jgi:hypothetical protein
MSYETKLLPTVRTYGTVRYVYIRRNYRTAYEIRPRLIIKSTLIRVPRTAVEGISDYVRAKQIAGQGAKP